MSITCHVPRYWCPGLAPSLWGTGGMDGWIDVLMEGWKQKKKKNTQKPRIDSWFKTNWWHEHQKKNSAGFLPVSSNPVKCLWGVPARLAQIFSLNSTRGCVSHDKGHKSHVWDLTNMLLSSSQGSRQRGGGFVSDFYSFDDQMASGDAWTWRVSGWAPHASLKCFECSAWQDKRGPLEDGALTFSLREVLRSASLWHRRSLRGQNQNPVPPPSAVITFFVFSTCVLGTLFEYFVPRLGFAASVVNCL